MANFIVRGAAAVVRPRIFQQGEEEDYQPKGVGNAPNRASEHVETEVLKQYTRKPEAEPPVRPQGPGEPDDTDDGEQHAGTHEPEPSAAWGPPGLPDSRPAGRDGTRAQNGQVPAARSQSHDRPQTEMAPPGSIRAYFQP